MMLLFLSLYGCQTESAPCTDFTTLDSGTGLFTYNGQQQTLEATWLQTGSTLQVNMVNQSPDGSSLTLRLSASEEGVPILELPEDTYPHYFSLGIPEQGTASFYPQYAGTISATPQEDSPGILTLESFNGVLLSACFSMTTLGSDGSSHTIENGVLKAAEKVFE
ncbi:MAG: hypothetical protein VX278_17460 [Myxococcota bacterium]|nr:hypothetical protein [Myxococcota bacterium]